MKKLALTISILVFAANILAASAGIACSGRISKTSNGYEANYFITDHLGSVRVIVGDNGEIKEQKDYYPFGKEHENASLMNSANRYTFSGKEQQTAGAVNWLDFGARMYDSQTGRWLTQDPLAENFYSVSQYAYCANNPVRYIDPNGMAWQEPDDDDDECDEEDDEHMDASDGGGGSGGGNNDDDDGYIFGGTLEESVCVARRPLSNAQIRYMVWNNTYMDYIQTHKLTKRELARIGIELVHMGHEKFLTNSATQNGITYLSWIAPIGKGITFLSNIIRTGAKLITKQAVKESATLLDDVAKQAKDWLGKDYKAIINKAGDDIFISKDGLRKIRFDIKNPTPHKNPLIHLEQLINGKWKGVRIYPKDVPHY